MHIVHEDGEQLSDCWAKAFEKKHTPTGLPQTCWHCSSKSATFKSRRSPLVPCWCSRKKTRGGLLQFKIHYLGYASVHDEWRVADEIVDRTIFLVCGFGFPDQGMFMFKTKSRPRSVHWHAICLWRPGWIFQKDLACEGTEWSRWFQLCNCEHCAVFAIPTETTGGICPWTICISEHG